MTSNVHFFNVIFFFIINLIFNLRKIKKKIFLINFFKYDPYYYYFHTLVCDLWIVKSRYLYIIMYICTAGIVCYFFKIYMEIYPKKGKVYSQLHFHNRTFIWLLPVEATIHTCICMTNVVNIAYLNASFYHFTNINHSFHVKEEKFNSFLSILRN